MKRKVDFITRLFEVNRCRIEMLEYLKAERMINDDTMASILNDHHTMHATRIVSLLEELLRTEKLQLVDYTWSILPKEYLCLTLVSAASRKEFSWSV